MKSFRSIVMAAAVVWAIVAAAAVDGRGEQPRGAPPVVDAPTFQPDPATVKRFGAGYRYPQAGWIVLHVEGEPYERGYQHGRLLAPEIERLVNVLAAYRTPSAPADQWRELRIMVNALFLRKYSPEYLEEMKGIADGAAAAGANFNGRPLDLLDIATLNSDVETTFLDEACDVTPTGLEGRVFPNPGATPPRPPREGHCSAFAAVGPATADGKIVFGHITMWNLYHAYNFNVWLDVKPARGHRVVMQTTAGGLMSGTDYYMNDAGIIMCETTIDQTRWNPDGKPLVDRTRRALQYGGSIDEVVAILKQDANGLYSNEWLIADVNANEIAMFEQGTFKTRLWRSGRDEWYGGTKGFYWGCNNAKDLEVRLETVRSVNDRPANVVFHPADRDRAWLKMFDKWNGKIDVNFGFEAFTTPPLSAINTLDAKFTTSAMARELTSWVRFGPPLGLAKPAVESERKRYGDVPTLICNDWTRMSVAPPAAEPVGSTSTSIAAVDLGIVRPGPDDGLGDPPAAWHGTILPETDADAWLAAAFADYERIVALESAFRARSADGELSPGDRDDLDLALFQPTSQYLSALARLDGKDVPLSAIRADLRSDEWYDIAAGKGVLVLAELRRTMGAEPFARFMDEFGRGHAGKTASAAEFFAAAEKAHGKPMTEKVAAWLGPDALGTLDKNVLARRDAGRFWSIEGFEHDPESSLIVYGTLAESDAQREAADILQKRLARRWSNIHIPIKADADATDADLKSNHVILVGRPATNAVSARFANAWAVRFGPASFQVRGETFAHPHTSILAAATNPEAADKSVVVIAGLSAEGTWRAVQNIPIATDMSAEVIIFQANGDVQSLAVDPAIVATPRGVTAR